MRLWGMLEPYYSLLPIRLFNNKIINTEKIISGWKHQMNIKYIKFSSHSDVLPYFQADSFRGVFMIRHLKQFMNETRALEAHKVL